MSVTFETRYKSPELSDVDIVLSCDAPQHDPADAPPSKRRRTHQSADDRQLALSNNDSGPVARQASRQILARFPAHMLLLCRCEYFKAQIERWEAASTSDGNSGRRPQLELALDSPDQRVAAEAVIASLYLVEDPFQALSKREILDAIIIADRLQAADVADQGMRKLLADHTPSNLSVETLDALVSLNVWPNCLLPALTAVAQQWSISSAVTRISYKPKMQQILLTALGDLGTVWADEQLSGALLELPSHAIQLLLSCDDLVVDSEDTVWYTATQYLETTGWQDDVMGMLENTIRCPQMSLSCLSTVALTTSRRYVLGGYSDELKQLLSLRLAHSGCFSGTDCCSQPNMHEHVRSNIEYSIENAPHTWSLPPRSYQPVTEVTKVWQVPVADIKQLFIEASESRSVLRRRKELFGPKTLPLMGKSWSCWLSVKPRIIRSGSDARLYEVWCYAGTKQGLPGTFSRVRLSLRVTAGAFQKEYNQPVVDLDAREAFEWDNVFGFPRMFPGPGMFGGWDQDLWTDEGLPVDGFISFSLTVGKLRV